MKYLLILLIFLSSCITCEVAVKIESRHHKQEEEYLDNLEKEEREGEVFDNELVEEHYHLFHSLDTMEFDVHTQKIPH